jgi:Cu/Ag efflux protein CusF
VKQIEGYRWTIASDSIASLDMGAMTMTFVKPSSSEGAAIEPGQRVSFSFVSTANGAFEIKKITLDRKRDTP